MLKKFLIFLILILNFNVFINAQNKKDDSTDDKIVEIDANTAVAFALKNNLGIESANLLFDQKKWATYTSWNVFVPAMSFNTVFSRPNVSSTSLSFSNGQLKQKTVDPDWNLGMTFSLTSTWNAKMFFNIYSTVVDYKNGKISLDTTKKQIERDVKKAYYNLIYYKNYIEIINNNLISAQKVYNDAIISYKNGLKPDDQVLSAQVDFENLKPKLADAQNNYDIALLSFKQSLGIKNDVKVELIDKTVNIESRAFDSGELIKKYLDNRLDLQTLNSQKDTLENLRNIYISSLTPSFILGFTVDPKFQNKLSDQSTWKYDSDDWKQSSGNLSFTISIPLNPLFPFSSDQMNIINNEYSIKQKNLDIKKQQLAAELEIETTVLKLNKSAKSLESLKFNVQLAQKSYQTAEAGYRAGTKTYNDVVNAKNALGTAQTNLLLEQVNYANSLLDLQYQTNSDLK